MRVQSPHPRRFVVAATLLLGLGPAASAAADTIYLKNGRVIHTERAVQEGDRIVFTQFGQTMRIPADQVLRIEKDESEGPEPLPVPAPAQGPEAGPEEAEEPAEGEPSEGEPAEGEVADGEEAEVPPEENPAYWRDRILAIRQEKADLEEQLVELRRRGRAFMFAKRSTAEIREQIEAAEARSAELDEEMAELQREARRLGVPPGWLRVREAPDEGQQQ